MIRYGAISLLFLSVFFMIRGISETWKNRTIPSSEVRSKQVPTEKGLGSEIFFNPTVSPTLPDFKNGYLFNEKRALDDEKGSAPEPEEANLEGNDLGIKTNINEATFSGAIIADTFKKALITYTAAPEAAAKKTKSSRASRRSKAPKKTKGALETAQLEEGDIISGYKVASIETDKIVFIKEGEVIEKYIYDPNKKRAKPVARAQPASSVPPRPRPGAPSPRTALPGAPKASSAQNAADHAAAQTPAPAPKTVTARKPSTAKRLVVSRKPPAKPDTSRVSRRSRSSAGRSMGSPPGMSRPPGVPPTVPR